MDDILTWMDDITTLRYGDLKAKKDTYCFIIYLHDILNLRDLIFHAEIVNI